MSLKSLLLVAPPDQLDKCVMPLIQNWSKVPTALQILEVCDFVAKHNVASEFTMQILESMYDNALLDEGKTGEEIENQAKWRK